MRTTRVYVALAMAGCICACTGTDRSTASATVRDSLGITIVENTWHADYLYATVVPQPSATIGVAEGDPHHELFGVNDAGRLSDGSIVLLNVGTRDFRVYDPNGVHVRTFGGRGDGPGEFQYVTEFLVLPGDTLLTVDRSSWRVAWLDSHGSLIRELAVERFAYSAVSVSVLPDASLLATIMRGSVVPREGLQRRPFALVHLDASQAHADTLGWFEGSEIYLAGSGGGGLRFHLRPFGRATSWAIGPQSVFVGWNGRYEIHEFAFDGRLLRIVRLDVPSREVTADLRDAYRTEQLEWFDTHAPEQRQHLERYLREVPWPDELPAFGSLQVDRQGNLWVGEYQRPTRTAAVFDVFDSEGVWLGKVSLPHDLRPLDIGADCVLGVRRDEMDVEQVLLHRIERLGVR